MKIEMRFPSKAPEFIDGVERMQITHGGVVYDVVACEGSELYVTLSIPLTPVLGVFPASTRGVTLKAIKR